ncbi:MAG: helix-turn-helix domain-containing protein, partial [Anaeroplasmataceae bacterium]|nr:helix-turn-helix domain-containing protein [Anaeroplasmataceae bacterium]
MEFKEKIKKLRIDKGLSQEALASELLTSRSTIAKWESGIRIPTRQSLELISQFFNVPIEELLDENEFQKIDSMEEGCENTDTFQTEKSQRLKTIDIIKITMKSIK